jgi:hypothetical protein
VGDPAAAKLFTWMDGLVYNQHSTGPGWIVLHQMQGRRRTGRPRADNQNVNFFNLLHLFGLILSVLCNQRIHYNRFKRNGIPGVDFGCRRERLGVADAVHGLAAKFIILLEIWRFKRGSGGVIIG